MSYQEKRSILSIFITITILTAYWFYVFLRFRKGNPDLVNDLSFWGLVILIFIGISILARIILEIILYIINTIVTKDEEDPSLLDERDKLIDLKAERISYVVVGIAFLLAMISLVMKKPAFVMVNIIFCSCFVGEIFRSISLLYFYKKGC